MRLPGVTDGGVQVYGSAISSAVAVTMKSAVTGAKALGLAIVREATKYSGARYVFGAAGPHVFDCSGLTQFVFHKFGIDLPHNADLQKHYGHQVPRSAARPGDLIFFVTSSGYAHHVAIYAGHDMMWEAPHTGAFVRHVQIWSNQIQFRRITK